jgi:hypothetical protein
MDSSFARARVFKKIADRIIVLIGIFICSAAGIKASFAQEMNTTAVLDGQTVAIRLDPRDVACEKSQKIVINKSLCFFVALNAGNAAGSRDLTVAKFDAQMPAHRHGMVTRPKIKAGKPGEYLIEGVKFHMPGDWKLTLDMLHGKSSAQVAIPLKL